MILFYYSENNEIFFSEFFFRSDTKKHLNVRENKIKVHYNSQNLIWHVLVCCINARLSLKTFEQNSQFNFVCDTIGCQPNK